MGVKIKINLRETYGGICSDFIWVYRRTDGEPVRTRQ